MTLNVGGTDRAVRITAGLFFLGLAFFHLVAGGWLIAAFIVGAAALLTGIFRFCPAYPVIGVNTHRARPAA